MNKVEPKRIPYEDIQERADIIAEAICNHPEFSMEQFKSLMRELLHPKPQPSGLDWPWVDRIRLVREVTSRVQLQRE